MRLRELYATALLLLATACATTAVNGSSTDVTLRAEPTTVSAGDSVSLILRNGSAQQVGYNLCASGLERREGAGWSTVPEDRICTMELRLLEPGAQARHVLYLPLDAPAGDYRYVTRVEQMDQGTGRRVASNSVSVRR